MTEQQTISVKIPVELARYTVWQRSLVNKYHTNAVIKAIDTWLVLKAETVSSFLQSWNEQKNHLLTICKCSESIFRTRLKLLQELKLLQYNRHNIRLCSWEQLGNILDIDPQQKLVIQYNINDKQRLQEWLIASEIRDNQCRQSYSIIKKLNKNPGWKQDVVNAMIKAGAEESKLGAPDYFLSWFKILYHNDFVKESDIHDIMIEIRPDTNRSVNGMAIAWNCKHKTTVSYWKKVLKKAGIIDIVKLSIKSAERVRNSACKVLWLRQEKQTLLCLPDVVTILTPWTNANEFLIPE